MTDINSQHRLHQAATGAPLAAGDHVPAEVRPPEPDRVGGHGPGIARLAAVFVEADQRVAFRLAWSDFVSAGRVRCGRFGLCARLMLTGDIARQPFGILIFSFACRVVALTCRQLSRAVIGWQPGADARRDRRHRQDPAAESGHRSRHVQDQPGGATPASGPQTDPLRAPPACGVSCGTLRSSGS